MLPDLLARPRYYILDGQTPVAVDLARWRAWHLRMPRVTVAATLNSAGAGVMTIFIGIDTRMVSGNDGHAPLFETYLTPHASDDETRGLVLTASTWTDAEHNHAQAVARCGHSSRGRHSPDIGQGELHGFAKVRHAMHRVAGFLVPHHHRGNDHATRN